MERLPQTTNTTGPQLREELATAVAARLRTLPSKDKNAYEREVEFSTATLQAADALVPQQKRTTLGRGWSVNTQTEAELSRTLALRRTHAIANCGERSAVRARKFGGFEPLPKKEFHEGMRACVRNDNGDCSKEFNVEQGLR